MCFCLDILITDLKNSKNWKISIVECVRLCNLVIIFWTIWEIYICLDILISKSVHKNEVLVISTVEFVRPPKVVFLWHMYLSLDILISTTFCIQKGKMSNIECVSLWNYNISTMYNIWKQLPSQSQSQSPSQLQSRILYVDISWFVTCVEYAPVASEIVTSWFHSVCLIVSICSSSFTLKIGFVYFKFTERFV